MAQDLDFDFSEDLDSLDWSGLEQSLGNRVSSGEDTPQPISMGGDLLGEEKSRQIVRTRSHVEIDYLMDVSLEVIVRMGKIMAYISDVLSWDDGSVVEFDKLVGEPLDLLINHKPVARGEVVVVNEKFGIKITEILDPSDVLVQLQT